MGYYTTYNLEVKTLEFNDHQDQDVIIAELRTKNENAAYAFDEHGGAEESTKWYDHDTDLIEFSKGKMDALFVLEGTGEEAGDLWRTYYLNGQKQICKAKITFDEFDVTKLK